MPRPVLALALLLLVACRSAPGPSPAGGAQARLAIRGNLVRADGTVLDDAVVLVDGGRVVRVGRAPEVPVPEGTPSVGGPDRWIVPGLVDAHVHFFQSGGLYTRPDVIDLTARVPYADERAAVRDALPDTFRRYLRAGVTSVVDFGGPRWNFAVRDEAARTALAPRVAVAGPLLSSVARPQLEAGDPPIVQVTDPAAARDLVGRQATDRPDFVKLWYVLPRGGTPEAWFPVAQAAIEEAHARGLRVAVHATELDTAKAALRAGADVLVHSVVDRDVDDDFVRMMTERRVPYVTTLTVFEGYWQVLNRKVRLGPAVMDVASPAVVSTVLDPFDLAPDHPARSRPPVSPAALRNARRLWAAGALVVAGTDAGNIGTFHGPALHRELELLVQAGLTPAQALAAATANAARLLGREDLGAVEPGRIADLVVLAANPLADVRNTRRIAAVVKGGAAYRPDEILPRSSADVVQAQVNAYNAQDLEAFLSTYAADAAMVRASGEVLNAGQASLRQRFGDLFQKYPRNHVRIAERRLEGAAVVVDHEIITGRAPERPEPWDAGWLRYTVEGGLIRRVVVCGASPC